MQVHAHPPRPGLQLAPHVRACACGKQVILLDLKRNKYIGVAGHQLAHLALVVDGWPVPPLAQDAGAPARSTAALAGPLVSQGLLTDRPTRHVVRPEIPEAVEPLDVEDVIDRARVGVREVRLLVQSALASALWLRAFSLQRIAAMVTRRRERLACRNTANTSTDTLRGAVASYARLRPLDYTEHKRCLLDSLTLVGFLAGQGMFPRWVTLAANIGIGRVGASSAEIECAARIAGLAHFIESQPEGYGTQVGERGLKLSGGERQRVAIARAILKQPRVYILDEATSMLDSRTEAAVLDGLRQAARDCTTITIAHRLSTVQHADEILVLDAGRFAECGRHAELLARNGTYARLWRAQLRDA